MSMQEVAVKLQGNIHRHFEDLLFTNRTFQSSDVQRPCCNQHRPGN